MWYDSLVERFSFIHCSLPAFLIIKSAHQISGGQVMIEFLGAHIDFILGYLLAISLVAGIATMYDKGAAQRDKRRIPENTLLLISLLGGSVAMYIVMRMINHKTNKEKFMRGIPLIIALQALMIFFAYRMNIYFS
jgi:uncharacterized membrane protein YsdA (DUF1294 family)